jgi:bifunctional DNase/RNase
MVEVEVAGVRVDLRSNAPVLLLQERTAPFRVVPIFIGVPEANAIHLALNQVEPSRPLTHDLLRTVIEELDAQVVRVEVTELRGGTYFANVVLSQGGIERSISARPSDAVALALRALAPIYVAESVMNAEGTVLDEDDGAPGAEDDELLGQFRDFIEHLRPEDFSE